MQPVLSSILDFLYPPLCLACGLRTQPGAMLCEGCLRDCVTLPLTDEQSVAHIASLTTACDASMMLVGWEYENGGVIERCIHALKYRRLHRVGEWLGRLLGERLMEGASACRCDFLGPLPASPRTPRGPARKNQQLPAAAFRTTTASTPAVAITPNAAAEPLPLPLLLPVPLHRIKRIERGYNQAEYLCRGIAAECGIEWDKQLLYRRRYTASQSASKLDQDERQRNVRDAFAVDASRAAMMKGRPLILVDDLVTTGATVCACVDVLVSAGFTDVRILAVARPPRH